MATSADVSTIKGEPCFFIKEQIADLVGGGQIFQEGSRLLRQLFKPFQSPLALFRFFLSFQLLSQCNRHRAGDTLSGRARQFLRQPFRFRILET
jgi:hypothetical protein